MIWVQISDLDFIKEFIMRILKGEITFKSRVAFSNLVQREFNKENLLSVFVKSQMKFFITNYCNGTKFVVLCYTEQLERRYWKGQNLFKEQTNLTGNFPSFSNKVRLKVLPRAPSPAKLPFSDYQVFNCI